MPAPPLSRVIRQGGSSKTCPNCGSTMTKKGFWKLFGERLCDNSECYLSKTISELSQEIGHNLKKSYKR